MVTVDGAHWQGWVSSDLRVLRITVEGLGAVELAGHEFELGARQRVEVGAQPTVTIRVEGLPFAPAGTRLAVEVLRGTPEGLHLERSSVAELDASAEARIALDGATERWVGLPATVWEGRRLRFTPERQRARPGGTARFTLVE